MPVVAKNILSQLNEEGWNINEEFLEGLQPENSMTYSSIVKILMNTDLKQCGLPSLPVDGKGKSKIKTPIILQVTNIRNVSAPKANEESQTAPRMLRVTLTDGTKYIHGLEYSFIKSLSLKTAPGTKLKLLSNVSVLGGYVMLNPSNVSIVGGVVEELYEKWKLSQSVSKYSRVVVSDQSSGGPPKWVPFGQMIQVEKEDNFKSLAETAAKKKEDDEFEHQRRKTVSELAKDSSQKVFGGGKQMLDSNVQKVISSGGFTIEEAEWALKKFRNDVPRAIQELRRIQFGDPIPTYEPSSPPEERGRGSRGGRGRRGRGKDNRGPDGSDDEVHDIAPSRPSRPASLFDYLEPKIRGDVGPPAIVEESIDSRSSRGRRGGRGRDRGARGRGRGYNQQKANSDVVLSQENWPSLGQEEEKESNHRTNASNEYQQAQAISPQESYYQPRRVHQESYRGGYSNDRGYNTGSYNQQRNYRDNQHSYRDNQSYQDNQHNYRDTQQGYRENKQNYRDNHQNYRDYQYNNRDTQQSYHSAQAYRGNNQQNYQNHQNHGSNQQNDRTGQQTYGSNQQNDRTGQKSYGYNQQNYQSNPSYGYNQQNYQNHQSYGANQQNDRTGQQDHHHENRVSQQQYQHYKSETQKYSDYDRENTPKKSEQSYYKPGMGRSLTRGGRGANSHHDGGAYYGERTQGSRSYEVENSAKERELIAQFQKSMQMGGFYKAPSYNSQYRDDYAPDENRSYSSNTDQQRFKGSYEYFRGGDGKTRRSRGPRRGRY